MWDVFCCKSYQRFNQPDLDHQKPKKIEAKSTAAWNALDKQPHSLGAPLNGRVENRNIHEPLSAVVERAIRETSYITAKYNWI